MDQVAAEMMMKNFQEQKTIWEELPPEAVESEEEFLAKRIGMARGETIEKFEELKKAVKDLTKVAPKEKIPKYTALAAMGIPPDWSIKKPWSAGTKLGTRILEDAKSRCMYESLKAGDYLGDAYLFLQRSIFEPEKNVRWQIKVMKKGEALESIRPRIYDTCGVSLPRDPLTHKNYEKYEGEITRNYRKKAADLEKVRRRSRSRFSYASVPRCGLDALKLAEKIGEIQSLILAGTDVFKPFPWEPTRKLILEKIKAGKGKKDTLETILLRLERDGCVCKDFKVKNTILIEEIKKKIKEGDMTVLEDLEELKDRFGVCLNEKTLPVKVSVPAEKAEKMPMEIVINSRIMLDLINKWGAEKAASEFQTEQKIMEIISNGFGKTFETP